MESKTILESFIEEQNYSSVFTSQKVAIKSLLKNQESPAFFLPLSHLTGTSSPFSIPSSLFSQLRLPVCKQLLCLALKASEVFVLFFRASEKRARQVKHLGGKNRSFRMQIIKTHSAVISKAISCCHQMKLSHLGGLEGCFSYSFLPSSHTRASIHKSCVSQCDS